MKVCLVEDERSLSEALVHILEANKMSVDAYYDGESGLDNALTGIYDVIVLDIMMPKKNGLEVLKELRKEHISTPVLLLTARSQVSDKITGLDSGADDYLTKPFSSEELVARIRALARRKGEIIHDNTLTYHDLSLDITTYLLKRDDVHIQLASKEFEILKYFFLRPTRIVNKEDLIVHVWGYDADVDYNNIEVYISFLRKKIQHVGSSVKITTLRHVGYKLEV